MHDLGGAVVKVGNCARCGGDHDDVAVFKFKQPFAPPEAAPIVWASWAECPTTGDPILISEIGAEPDRPVGTFDDALEAAYWIFDSRRAGTHAEIRKMGFGPQPERDAFKAAARELFSVWKGRTP